MSSFCEVDQNVWKQFSGPVNNNNIPLVGENVYYFPEGHAEHSISPPLFSPSVKKKPMILSRVLNVRFLANSLTDQIFARIQLLPLDHPTEPPPANAAATDNEDMMFDSFTKKLTMSDANCGGGFTLPKRCAKLIFPQLNYADKPPAQMISVKDVQGAQWDIRHVYRGSPRRHLLTTGWSRFINAKNLIPNDSVTFTKNKTTDEYYIGIRRAVPVEPDQGIPELEGEFSRMNLGKVSPESVTKAAELAAENMSFEVIYYPTAGGSAFVVNSQLVDKCLSFHWGIGLEVKMAVEAEDSSSKKQWYKGRVVSSPSRVISPWRMLLVEWENGENMKKEVNPWQLENMKHNPTPNLLYYSPSFEIPNFLFIPADNGMQGARQPHHHLHNMPNLPYSTCPFLEMLGSKRKRDFFSHSAIPYSIHAANGMQGARQQEPLPRPPTTHLIHNEAMTEPPPIIKESVEEGHTDNSSTSFKLFGKIISVKVDHSLPNP